MSEKLGHDRRRSTRLKPKAECYLVFRPTFERLGKLTDISHTGVAFEYPALHEWYEVTDTQIDIFSAAEDFHLPEIPCKVVYDIVLRNFSMAQTIQSRRCGLQFDGLSKNQCKQLDYLLEMCSCQTDSSEN